ncbi:MAG TPA: tRNA (adenosine(37)-N6)-threonylcarbamoyltransferase complex dimerization subunit type 1 TsaB [Caulobacteraceae bacterium]|nr:tRNA (adenosine(37)-N6)-threonylcarbamoyltransferase complex dimerization subunit type 1 TsaB [Caulobacteraceae bacterium]
MRVLAIDTCLDACQAALISIDEVVFARSEPMHRGHQERLAPMLAEAMAAAGSRFAELDRIGVTVGPGSFTGLRVGLAFAKGLAIARQIRCVGVGVLEALAVGVDGRVLAAIDARRDQVYLQLFDGGRAMGEPEAVLLEDAGDWISRHGGSEGLTVTGSGAPLLAGLSARLLPLAAPDPVAIARIAAADPATAPARPIYLRAPDARLPA